MKVSLLSVLLFLSGMVKATNYYVDASATSAIQNGTLASPWKTLSQVSSNMSSFVAGDIISFKKGGTYPGQLVVNRSGAAGNPITFNSYGTGNAPVFSGTGSRISYLIYIFNRSYITFDGINVTDPTLSPTDRTIQSNIERAFYLDGTSANIIIRNCSISLVGVGVFLTASGNTIEKCTIENLRMVVNTNNGGYDDYGANAFVIDDANNTITNNIIRGCWANSYDFTYDGGAIEFNGPEASNNKIMYNTIIDCNGVMEMGSNSTVGVQTGNVIAYNKMINNGSLLYINNTGPFAVNVSNHQFYNNVIVETVVGRLSDQYLAGMASASASAGIVVMKNNIFWLTNGVDVARSGQFSGSQLTHEDNIFKLGTGSVLNFTASATELTTNSSNIFANVSTQDPTAWDYVPSSTSPAIDFGQNVGIPKDFAGNIVPTVPNSGILETGSGSIPAITAIATAGTITCNGGTATVTVTASGGTAPYTGTGTFTVSAGSYTYTVTDATGLTGTTTINVNQPAVLIANIAAGTIATYGGTTSLTVSVTGGTASYSYKLNNGVYQSSNVFTSLTAGTYSITVKDANGCTYSKNVTITQPAYSSLAITAIAGFISCNQGTTTVTVNATGGTPPYSGTGTYTVTAGTYSYSVTDATNATRSTSVTIVQPPALSATVTTGTISSFGGSTNVTVAASGGTLSYSYKLDNGSYQSGNIFSGVLAGAHTITVMDGKGCTIVKSITLSQPANTAFAAVANAGTILCNGGSTTVAVTATGGTAPYTGTGTFTVNAGTYSYTIRDAAGRIKNISVTINQPAALTLTLNAGTIAINGGVTSLTVTAGGGTGAYSYKLNNGSYQSSNVFTGVVAGTYTVTVKDANGCTASKSITITQPSQGVLQASSSAGTISCNGGTTTVTVSASGGTAPYTGTGTFTVSAGTYSYTVRDAAGASKSTTITVSQPAALAATVAAGTISAYGGTTSLTVTASGGTSPYTYKLNNGSYQASKTFSAVPAGTHSITIADAKGCTIVKSITITQPLQILLVSSTNNSCRFTWDGTVTVSAGGGVPPYTYQINSFGYGVTATFINLGPNTYTLSAKDATGTISTMPVTILASSLSCTTRSGKGDQDEQAVTATTVEKENFDIIAYPNPSSAEFYLRINNGSTEVAEITVMNMEGKIVERLKSNGRPVIQLGKNLSSGNYVVSVKQGGKIKTTAILKSN